MTAAELKNKYEEDLKNLQENCPHSSISDWVDEYWAPGHSTFKKIKYCRICWKTVEEKDLINLNIHTIGTSGTV